MSLIKRFAIFCEMIKISHTLFALPFAIGAAFLAADGMPTALLLVKIVLAVLCARTSAMAFNRLADRKIDLANPRTADRALPSNQLSVAFVTAATALSLAGFFATCYWINDLALKLSPLAAALFLGYSLTKRISWLCHAVLGMALAFAPIGAWVAVKNDLEFTPICLGLAVLFWTAGFDILYSCMDYDFDRRAGLFSIPARLGITKALKVAAGLHIVMLSLLYYSWWQSELLNWVFLSAVGVVSVLILIEHRMVKPNRLGKVNQAFFTMNVVISLLIMASLIIESYL